MNFLPMLEIIILIKNNNLDVRLDVQLLKKIFMNLFSKAIMQNSASAYF